MFAARKSVITFTTTLLLLLVACVANAGDGVVEGAIKVDGKPLADGRIFFYMADGQFFGSKVKDGAFHVDRAPPGMLAVTIEGEGVPAKYTLSDSTSLMVNVKADAKNRFDFNLQ